MVRFVGLLGVNEREGGVVALHLPTVFFVYKQALCWSRYRDANPVPTSPLADDLATEQSGPVRRYITYNNNVLIIFIYLFIYLYIYLLHFLLIY